MVARVLENGCLDSAFASDGGGLRRWSVHPQTGAAIKDFELPMLAAARDLAIAAQAHFRDGFAVTGWDIGLAADGPVLIESSEERSVGQACVRTCRYRWTPDH